MKNHLLSIAVVVFSLLGISNTAFAQGLYVLGEVEANSNIWAPDKGQELTSQDGKVFTGTIVINKPTGHFSFTSKLDPKWENIAGSRYGAEADGTTLVDGTPATLKKGESAFKAPKGLYNITVDLTAMTVLLASTGEKPQITIPDALYILGEVEANGFTWAPNKGQEMVAEGNGVFTATATIGEAMATEGMFSFTSKLAADVADWASIANNRYGAEKDGTPLEPNVPGKISFSEYAFKVAKGIYKITVDFKNESILVVKEGEGPKPTYPETLFILGETEANGSVWTPTKGQAMTSAGNGVFTATATLKGAMTDGFFSFTTQLGTEPENWAAIASYRFGAEAENTAITPGTEAKIVKSDFAFSAPNGTYTITVDLSKMSVLLVSQGGGEEPKPTFPEALFVIGTTHPEAAQWWKPNDSDHMLIPGETEGIYLGDVTIYESNIDPQLPATGFGFFTVGATLATGETEEDWAVFNADRYGPEITDTELATETASHIGKHGDTAYKIAVGTYTLRVNLTDNTILATQKSGIDTTVENESKVIASNGVITVSGNANNIAVYNAAGSLISTKAETETANGIYIVVVDGKAHKIAVR